MPLLSDVTAALDSLYPPALAEDWDAVGLVVGDPGAEVRRVLLAIDPVKPVVDEALAAGCDLLVTHHPLYLRGTTSVAADDPKGRVVQALVRGGCGLFVAHTNADKAVGGVNDVLAALLGLQDPVPLVPETLPLSKLVVFVPADSADAVRDAVVAAGAGRLGDYECCSWSTTGTGTFRPLPGASPAVGSVGELTSVEEVRLEAVVATRALPAVVAALRAAHPYETPAFDVVPLSVPAPTGIGRVGDVAPTTVGDLASLVESVLPPTLLRVAGDLSAPVRRVAVSGGAGDDLMGAAAAAGAQAYLTADLRHHMTIEAPEGLALLDASHWATEQPWLSRAADALASLVDVEVVVSTLCTDPWTSRSSAT